MGNLLRSLRTSLSRQDNDFTTRVILRYKEKAPVSSFAKGLFQDEDAASLNSRILDARTKAVIRHG